MTALPVADPRRRRSARRTLVLLALVCAAPVIASYVAYYWLRPAGRVNYGELLGPVPAPEIIGVTLDQSAFRLSELRGRWVLLMAGDNGCDARCERKLYATRQARTMQGRDQDRVVRVWVESTGAPPPSIELLALHPGMTFASGDARQWETLPPGREAVAASIYLVDPLGNIVLRYPADPDIKRLAKDLERLLKASRIG